MNNLQDRVIDILLVEDSDDDVILTEEAFKESGFSIRLCEVTDGEEALRVLRREGEHLNAPRPHLVILDLNLPLKSGLSVLKDIKTDERLKTIPVIVLSTSQMECDILATTVPN